MILTRMNSSRMRTSSGRGGGVSQHALAREGVCIPAFTGQGGICPGGCLSQCMLGYMLGCVYPSMHWAGVCVCLGGVFPGGCLPRGFLPRRGVCPNACWDTPPLWTEWLTDRCKNITFPQLRCRMVINGQWLVNPSPARGFVNSISSSTTCFSVMEELFDGIA